MPPLCFNFAHGLNRLSYSTPKRSFHLVHRGRWFPLVQEDHVVAAFEANGHGQAIANPQDIRQDTFKP